MAGVRGERHQNLDLTAQTQLEALSHLRHCDRGRPTLADCGRTEAEVLDVATIDVERRGNAGQSAVGHGHTEIDATMWTLSVVVGDVLPKHSLQLPASEDEHVVETFVAHGSHPAFRVGIGPGRSDRCLDHPDALGAQDLVEAGRELGVPIRDQELDGSTAVYKAADQVASHLGDEHTGRMVGDTEDVQLSSRQFDDQEHVELLSDTVSTMKKSVASTPCAWEAKNLSLIH